MRVVIIYEWIYFVDEENWNLKEANLFWIQICSNTKFESIPLHLWFSPQDQTTYVGQIVSLT